ncbi:MAG: hypothetical protein ACRDXX_12615 [Stackebrandtia sp.]
MGPHVDRALTAVGLRKRPRRRWPWIAASAIAVTAAASAAAVLLLRRNAKMHEEESLEEDTRPEDRTYEEMIEESEPVGNAPYTSRSDNTKERAMTGA